MNKFPLKLNNLKEGKTYERESGGYVIVKSGGYLLAQDDKLDFQKVSDFNELNCGFEISSKKAPQTLREVFTNYTEDNSAERKERNRMKLLSKLVDEVELLKKGK